MSIFTYLKRGYKYIKTGTPNQQILVNVTELSPSDLLIGKNALITGGTSGIGKAIAIAFLKAGANVVITSRNHDAALRTVEEINKFVGGRGKIYGVELDTKKVTFFDRKIREILTFPGFDTIDILVNNAGVNKGIQGQPPDEEYDDILNTNLKGYYFLSESVADYMVKNHVAGNILNIASASSLRPANTPYILSKWGVRGLTLGMAKKYLKHNIVVNGLAPGPTATPMLLKNETNNYRLSNNPSGRYALPEEIANIAVILTSQMGRLIVGDIVYITGGAGVITYDDIKY